MICKMLCLQVGQLEIQIDVLQKLRESEGKKRSQTASENLMLLSSLEEKQHKIKQLNQVSKKFPSRSVINIIVAAVLLFH